MDTVKNAAGFLNEPIPSFFFEVVFVEELSLSLFKQIASLAMKNIIGDTSAFSDVQGLTVSYKTGSIKEAGWSSPRPTFDEVNNDELTLIRYLRPRHMGMGPFSLDSLTEWCQETMETVKTWEQRVKKKNIKILVYHPMLNATVPVAGFILQEAFPVSWGISDLSSTAADAPIKETIKFKYTEIKRLEITLNLPKIF